MEERAYELEQHANKCPNFSSTDHSTPTTECMGIYFTDWGTMGSVGDEGYDAYLNSM